MTALSVSQSTLFVLKNVADVSGKDHPAQIIRMDKKAKDNDPPQIARIMKQIEKLNKELDDMATRGHHHAKNSRDMAELIKAQIVMLQAQMAQLQHQQAEKAQNQQETSTSSQLKTGVNNPSDEHQVDIWI